MPVPAHLQKESDHLFSGIFSTQQQHVLFSMQEIVGCKAEEIMCDPHINCCDVFKAMTPHDAHSGSDNRLSGKPIICTILKPENVAWQVKCANLATSVGESLITSDSTPNELIDAIR